MIGRHFLYAIMLTENPKRPNFVCCCGEIASGVSGAEWVVDIRADGFAGVRPSVNWPGHFHNYPDPVPIIKYSDLPVEAVE